MARKREFSLLELDQYRATLLEAITARLVQANNRKSYLSASDVLHVGCALLGHEHEAVIPLAVVMPQPQFLVWYRTTGFNRQVIPVPRDHFTVVVPANNGRAEIDVCVDARGIVIESSGTQLAKCQFTELVPRRDNNDSGNGGPHEIPPAEATRE